MRLSVTAVAVTAVENSLAMIRGDSSRYDSVIVRVPRFVVVLVEDDFVHDVTRINESPIGIGQT